MNDMMKLIKARKEYENIFGVPTFFRMFQDGKRCYISFPRHKEYYQGITIGQAIEACESLIKEG